MRFSAIVLLLSCGTLQPIQAALPEPAPPLKLILDNRRVPLSIAHGGYGTAVLFQNSSDEGGEEAVCTLTMIRKGRSIDYPLPVPQGKELRLPSNDDGLGPSPYWKHILCVGEKGTCLVAGSYLSDLVFVPAENAKADFPHLVPLVAQAQTGGKKDWLLYWAWTNQAKDRLLLFAHELEGDTPRYEKPDVLYYLAKGKDPRVLRDATPRFLSVIDYLSARALFLKDDSAVYLCRDRQSLLFFPAAQSNDQIMKLPDQCKGMSWEVGKQIRLLMQKDNVIFAPSLTFEEIKARFGAGCKTAAMPVGVPLATYLGEQCWVYPTEETELILWSEEEGVAAAPLISDMYMWQVADDGHVHRRILYCLAANESQSIIGAIDTPPDILYQEAKKLKKAPLCFPVRGLYGTAGFYVAETKTDGTFYPSPTDGSFFSLENGKPASIPLPNDYAPEQIKQVTCWFCPAQKLWQLYLALVTDNDHFKLYGLRGNAQERFSHKIRRGSQPKLRFSNEHSYKNMQWVVNQETNSPVLVLLPRGGASHLQTLRGLPLEVKLSEETELPLFTFLGDCNLAASTTEDRIHVYRLSVTSDEEMEEKLAATPLFNCSRGLANPKVSMLLSIQERGIERVLLRTEEQMYCTNFPFEESGEACTPHTEKIEDGHFLLPSAFAAHYIGNRAIGHASDTGGRPCVIVADDEGELSCLHFVPTFLVVSGYLRRLGCRVEDLVADMIRLLERSLGGALLVSQEQTLWRPALVTWSNHFVPFAFSSHIKKNQHVEVKCRALVRFQQ